ncbi:MAG TPA: AbrB/MazE/SpoVT family DNA-binding domain-containing protein [Chloroflexota bacterium]|nr:AbrB/MazE/SpoVT family DNA-binding domain-containing protein [Chloroflexota bacterium]
MATKVGAKGQVVIDQAIRQKLGIRPGMLAVQRLVDDHVELRFLAGSHRRSLAGAARPFIRRFPSAEELQAADELWAAEVRRHAQPHTEESGV